MASLRVTKITASVGVKHGLSDFGSEHHHFSAEAELSHSTVEELRAAQDKLHYEVALQAYKAMLSRGFMGPDQFQALITPLKQRADKAEVLVKFSLPPVQS